MSDNNKDTPSKSDGRKLIFEASIRENKIVVSFGKSTAFSTIALALKFVELEFENKIIEQQQPKQQVAPIIINPDVLNRLRS